MTSCSLLYDDAAVATTPEAAQPPEFFTDLQLHGVVDRIISGREEYDLAPIFYSPLHRAASIDFRFDVLRDLELPSVRSAAYRFGAELRSMRDHLRRSYQAYYARQKQRWFLEAANTYRKAIADLCRELQGTALRSEGWRRLQRYLEEYTASDVYRSMAQESEAILHGLTDVRYCVRINGLGLDVGPLTDEIDYSGVIAETFAKFERELQHEYQFRLVDSDQLNHVEAAILDRVALLYPKVFSDLARFCDIYRDYVDPTISRFDRELQFYLACIEHVKRISAAGLQFCYPSVQERSRVLQASDTFDLALAEQLQTAKHEIVTNDFKLVGPERVLVISGPNQSGKSTFARIVGQLHYLASIGCPVPGRDVCLTVYDHLLTQFDREESGLDRAGKLEQDLRRMRAFLNVATAESILILNETFNSTTLNDSLVLNKEILRRIIDRGSWCVTVTFLEELAAKHDSVVSMVGNVDGGDPNRPVFRFTRRPADGLAYARAIAQKHGLTAERIRARLCS